MNCKLDAENIGEQLGTDGVSSVVSKAEAYCSFEERRIMLANYPRIVACQAEASSLLDDERDLVGRLRLAPPPGDLRSRRRKAFYHASVAAVLTFAAFIFSLYSFDPFRLGVKSYLYCVGIAVVTPFLVDKLIEWWNAKTLIKGLATVACVGALTSLVLLALIRGDLLVEEINNSRPVITFDDAGVQPAAPASNFYEKSIPMLQVVMALLALAMELGAGLALHEAWRLGPDAVEDWEELRKHLREVRSRLIYLASEITALQNEPQLVSARFWRNFYRAMLTHTVRSAMTRFVLALVAILVLAHGHAAAQNQTMLVIAVDLTQSVDVRGTGQKSEFQKNLDAVTSQLVHVPEDSRVTVIGITDQSFTEPDILLSAEIPTDRGYFGERLAAARRELVRVWTTRSATLEPHYRCTDIMGVLLLAARIFDRQGGMGRRELLIYSDMRHRTPALDLESPATVLPFGRIGISLPALPRLSNVGVYVQGVDGVGKSLAYWESLRRFWVDCFRSSGAVLKDYSPLRSATNPTEGNGPIGPNIPEGLSSDRSRDTCGPSISR